MKRSYLLLSVLIAVMLISAALILSTHASAATSGTTGDCTWSLNGTVLTISGNGKMGDYILGNSAPWWGKPVTEVVIENGVTYIGEYSFYLFTDLTSIDIPGSVTEIGDFAFAECYNLASISVPDSVTMIGTYSFHETAWFEAQPEGLVYVGKVAYCVIGTVPANLAVKDGTKGIVSYCFSGADDIVSVTIPASVTRIGTSIFSSCSSLESITVNAENAVYHSDQNCLIETESKTVIAGCKTSLIPLSGVNTIGEEAFTSCKGLTSVSIPQTVNSIGKQAFSHCRNLASVTIDSHVFGNGVSIGDYAFIGCNALTSITLPQTLISIGEGAFSDCDGLSSVTVPNRVTTVGESAFSNCSNLTEVVLGNGISSIEDEVFYQCGKLASVTIPNSVKTIGRYAFGSCPKLKSVWYVGDAQEKANLTVSDGNFYLNSAFWHYVDFVCDPVCNECGAEHSVTHEPGAFQYDDEKHWKTCNVCGEKDPETLALHGYDYDCDDFCNECGKTRTAAAHVYDKDCTDADCNVCGKKRTVLGHFYEDACSAECAFCGIRRAVSHQYSGDCDNICNVCKRKRQAPHVFADSEDQTCDSCGAKRPSYTHGDLDGNSGITTDDAIYLLFYTYFPERYPINQCVDYDGNGKESVDDAIYLLFHVNYPELYPLSFGIYWNWPLPKESPGVISASYSAQHTGIDISVGGEENKGKIPALAAADGVVIRAGTYADWGNLVVIDHGDGYLTYYAHLDSISVSLRETVYAGDELGKIGATGKTTEVKLSFVLYAPDGASGASVRTDPLKYVKFPK